MNSKANRDVQSASPRHVRRTTLARFLALTVLSAVLVIANTVTPAEAQTPEPGTTFCGRVIEEIDPGHDPRALDKLLQQGNDDVLEMLFGWTGLGPEICVPAEEVQQLVVGRFFGRLDPRLNRIFQVLKVTRILTDIQPLPTRLPDVGAGVSAPVSWTGGQGLSLRTGAGTSTALVAPTAIPEGTMLPIICQVQGEPVTNGYTATELWDFVTWNGLSGYVSDAYLDTGTSQQVAANC